MEGTSPSFLFSTIENTLYRKIEGDRKTFSISAVNISSKYKQVKHIPSIKEFDKNLLTTSLISQRDIILDSILKQSQQKKKQKHSIKENSKEAGKVTSNNDMEIQSNIIETRKKQNEEEVGQVLEENLNIELEEVECECIKKLLNLKHIIPVYDYRDKKSIQFPSDCFSWIIILLHSYIILGKLFDSCIIFDFENSSRIPEIVKYLNRHVSIRENIFTDYSFFYNSKLGEYQKNAAVCTIQKYCGHIESLNQPVFKLKHFYYTLKIELFQIDSCPVNEDVLSQSNIFINNIHRIREDSLMLSFMNNSFGHK